MSNSLRHATRPFHWLSRVARYKLAMCVLAAAIPLAIRIALLPELPVPQPYVHDEFSYLLAAETFASGRVTNPPHPMWIHFETFHELMQPTYMSKYPPGQALFLAMGWKLFGHPWIGVWLSYGIFAFSLCWMLQNWLPAVYALLGTAITLTQVSLHGYWMNSYWGGAAAAIAGCLLLGVLPRLARREHWQDAALGAVALVLLANTRPYEGLMMSAAAFVALLLWRRRRKQPWLRLFSLQLVIPMALICGAGAFLDGYYNHRVTGHVFLLPYTAYSQQYVVASPFLVFSPRTPPLYRYEVIERYWTVNILGSFENYRAHPLANLDAAGAAINFYGGAILIVPLAFGCLLCGSYRARVAAALCFSVWLALAAESVKQPHYIAGAVGLVALTVVYALRWLRVAGRRYGPALALAVTAVLCAHSVIRQSHVPELGAAGPFVSQRDFAVQTVTEQGGKHLVLVRYSPGHDLDLEFVFNHADIDASQIVWAHDAGEAGNRELIEYYGGSRKVWLWQPDSDPPKLTPYDPAAP